MGGYLVYLLYGQELFQLNQRVDEIINKKKVDDINIVKYTFDNNIKEIIDDASTISLFDDIKIIIVDQANIFDSKLDNMDYLEDYLNNPNPATTLVFKVNTDKLDTRRKIYKIIKEKGKIEEFNSKFNAYKYVSDLLKDYRITNNTKQLIIKRLGNNPDILKSEIDKLIIYKGEDKIITDNDIVSVMSHYIDTNIFTFMDNIINKNKKDALITYHELLKINEEPIKIVIMLANNFRLMYQASNLIRMGYSENDICKITGKSPYPVKLAIQKGSKYDNDTLLNILDELADLDYKIKTSGINKSLALELFILKL